jgi:hypothetical protein
MKAMSRNISTSAMLVLALSLVSACNGGSPKLHEIARVASPSKQIDLVIAEVSTDATVPTPFEVFVVEAGKTPSSSNLVFKIDKSSQPQAEWADAATATIKCAAGRIWHFQNFASVALQDGNVVSVSVSANCADQGYK